MSKVLYAGKKPVKSVFFNSIEIYKSPTLRVKADFVNQVYKQNGENKTFSELFDFSRAGKAWLVEDTGLQEYAIDVPRFEDGLLIEESATNYFTYSLLQSSKLADNFYSTSRTLRLVDDVLKVGNSYLLPRDVLSYGYKSVALLPQDTAINIDVYVSKDNGSHDIDVRNNDDSSDAYTQAMSTDIRLDYMRVANTTIVSSPFSGGAPRTGLVRFARQNTRTGNIIIHAMQATADSYTSSLIVTETSPVTRPADFIKTKNPITKVTGDWDLTLNISVVDGQLTHTGYGRIRTMEVEYV